MDPRETEGDAGGDRIGHLEARIARLERLVAAAAEALAWVVVGAPLALILVKVKRPAGLLWPQLFDASHVLVSGLLALVALRLSRRVLADRFASPWPHYAVAAAVVFAVGAGLEVLQLVMPGQASLRDLVLDVIGGAAALLFALSVRDPSGRSLGRSAATRWALRGAALCVLALGLAPSARSVVRFAARTRTFPLLADFEAAQERRFLSANDGAVLTRVPPPSGFARARGRSVGRVVFGSGTYPNLELADLAGDWSKYTALVFDVFSPEPRSVSIKLRVHDRGHGSSAGDRFNREIRIPPGESTVRVPTESIRAAPRGRTLDLTDVESVILFMRKPETPTTLYFDGFCLE